MLALEKKLAYLILGMKGGENRIQIIKALFERPYNINQLSQVLDLNYRTVKHHLSILYKNEIISTSKAGGYGDVYFLSPKLEGNFEIFTEIEKKFENSKKLSEIAESRKYYQDIIEQSNDAIILKDLEGRVFFWNKGAEKLFGYLNENILGQINPIIPEEKQGEYNKILEKVLNEEIIFDYETQWKKKNGKLIDVSSSISPIKDKENNHIGISIISRDISERISHQREIENEREKFKQFFENEPEYCYIISPKGIIIDVNKAALNGLGYKKNELVGKPLKIVYAPEYLQKMKTLLIKWKKTGKLKNEEMVIITKKGIKRTVLLSVDSIKSQDDKISHSVSVQRDITVLKKAEDALKHSEQRYELAQRAANIGSWDWDITTGDLQWSDTIAPLFGFKRGEFGATFDAFIESVHPKDRKFVEDSVNACIEKSKDYDIEHRIVWPNGNIHWVSETGDVIRDKNGKAVRMLGIVQDITERKKAVEELKKNLEMFDDILSALGAGLILIDLDKKIIWGNRTSVDLFGQLENIKGKNCYEIYWGRNDPCGDCLCGEVEKNGKMKLETQVRTTKEGVKKKFLIASTPIKDENGKVVQVLELILDIEKGF